MVHRVTTDDWLHLMLYNLRRLLFSRCGHLLIGITTFSIILLWVKINFDYVVLQDTSSYSVKEIIYPYYTLTEEINPAQIEQERRMTIFTRILRKQMRKQKRTENRTHCIHPKLSLKHDSNQFAYYDLPALNCTGNGLFFSQSGMIILNSSVMPVPSLLGKCSFYGVERVNDNVVSFSKPETKESPPFSIHVPYDFVRIRCVLNTTLENQKLKNQTSAVKTGGIFTDKENEQQSQLDYKTAYYGHEENEKKAKQESSSAEAGNKQNSFYNSSAPVDYENFLGYDDMEWLAYASRNEAFSDPDYETSDFDQYLVQVHPRPQVFQRIEKIEAVSMQGTLKLNVLMFALDSMSHLSYQRKLPSTYKYLKEELGAAIMENYNIVGDATTAAIIPMLTGMTEMDLPEVRISKQDAGMVDEYPMIWKKFQEHGYATLFAEDEPSLSTFNLRLNGFTDIPTDHYMRPFWQSLWDSSIRYNSERFCSGDIAHHRFMLHYLEDFFVKYSNVSKFAFGFHGELTHADNNPAQYIDAELVSFLERLRRGKLLENTVVIVFGDHGARYSKVRNTIQGKLEERLPFMSFAFPSKFRKMYPELYRNLRTNTQRLSTPFDIHATLVDIDGLSWSGKLSQNSQARGISLLREIPASRTCKDAGVSMHWCACLHQVTVDKNEEFVKPAVMELMQHLNAQTTQHKNECAELKLKEVLRVQMIVPNERVLKYRQSKDSDQREAKFSSEVDLDIAHYQLQVETGPCGAVYEATVMADFRDYLNYKFTVTPGISRINRYGSQPKCIQENYPFLRKFCCCKDYLKSQLTVKNGDHLKGPDSAMKEKYSGEQMDRLNWRQKYEPTVTVKETHHIDDDINKHSDSVQRRSGLKERRQAVKRERTLEGKEDS